jgi:hypothetical protein
MLSVDTDKTRVRGSDYRIPRFCAIATTITVFPGLISYLLVVSAKHHETFPPTYSRVALCSFMMPPVTGSPDLATSVQELTSAMERRVLDIAMRNYNTDSCVPIDVFLEEFGDWLTQSSNSSMDLKSTIVICSEVFRLRPEGHERHAVSSIKLGLSLAKSCEELHIDISRLSLSIALLRHGAELLSSSDDVQVSALTGLANALKTQFARLENFDALAEAIDVYRQTLVLSPLEHPDRSISLNNLASALITRFEQSGDLDSLAEAIDAFRQAVGLYALGHPNRFILLGNLASALTTRFERFGDLNSLAEAIDLHRQALSMGSLGHPKRSRAARRLGFPCRGD